MLVFLATQAPRARGGMDVCVCVASLCAWNQTLPSGLYWERHLYQCTLTHYKCPAVCNYSMSIIPETIHTKREPVQKCMLCIQKTCLHTFGFGTGRRHAWIISAA